MKTWETEAEKIVSSSRTDYRKIIREIAKSHPRVVVIAEGNVNHMGWVTNCRLSMLDGNRIGAVNLCREATGRSIEEAKKFVDALIADK